MMVEEKYLTEKVNSTTIRYSNRTKKTIAQLQTAIGKNLSTNQIDNIIASLVTSAYQDGYDSGQKD